MDPSQHFEHNPKTGYNINNKINPNQLAFDFVNYYYEQLKINPQQLINDNILRPYTTFKYNSIKYNKDNLVLLLSTLSQCTYNILKIESIESGSRRIDINVIGQINESIFTQSFIICFKDIWFVKNSILIHL